MCNVRFSQLIKNPITWAFVIPLAYWLYLGCVTRMIVIYDALAYENLASTIYHEGWVGFFRSEPQNVPLYPFIISLAMRLGDLWGISYLPIQTGIQVLFFAAGQILLFKILRLLNIRPVIASLTLGYFGISPALVNSAFSLYCEIITYPFVLGIILCCAQSWRYAQEGSVRRLILSALNIIVLFIFLTAVREINEYVLPLFLLTYLAAASGFLAQNKSRTFIKILGLLVGIFAVYTLSLLPYKHLNLKYNGHKALVIKGATAFYANAAARTRPLTTENVLTFIARIPGEFVCTKLYGEKACDFWWNEAHVVGLSKTQELRDQGVPNEVLDDTLYKLGIEMILKNLPQYAFLTAAEGLKMLFWESTQIGFVTYPDWLQNIYQNTLLKNALRLTLFLLTLAALVFTIGYLWKHRSRLSAGTPEERQESLLLYFSLAMIAINILLHSPFLTATRYAFPIAPLYLALMAFTAQKLFFKK